MSSDSLFDSDDGLKPEQKLQTMSPWNELSSLSQAVRHDIYAKIYDGGISLLTNLAQPTACKLFPSLAPEIFEAYLRHTTFYVKVWINYDGVEDSFYNDETRAQHCGKLRLSKRQREHIQTLLDGRAAICRIVIEFCTFLNSYCTLQINTSGVAIRDRFSWTSLPHEPSHYNLCQHLVSADGLLQDADKEIFAHATAFGLQELDLIASLFKARLEDGVESVFETDTGWTHPRSGFREWAETDGDAKRRAMLKRSGYCFNDDEYEYRSRYF